MASNPAAPRSIAAPGRGEFRLDETLVAVPAAGGAAARFSSGGRDYRLAPRDTAAEAQLPVYRPAGGGAPLMASGRIIVALAPGVDAAALARPLAQLGFEALEPASGFWTTRAVAGPGAALSSFAAIAALDGVAMAQPELHREAAGR